MSRLRLWMLGLCCLWSVAEAPYAADDSGAFAVRGPGGLPCQAFVEARAGADGGRDFLLWADGFLSAANLFAPRTFDFLPWGNANYLALLLEGHCKRHPEQPFHVALARLLERMKPHRLERRSELVEAQGQDAKVRVYAETLRRLQQVLQEKGLYDGPIDGRYDDALAQAIARFQRRVGLPHTGLPDYATLHRALISERNR